MRVPLEWLHDHVRPDLPAAALAERLAMTGTEVERVEAHGVAGVEHFVVGRVVEAVPHPDADRLKVCQVDIGEAELSQIVCGAPNVAAGQTVAVARPGAVMPDGTKLRRAKLRGEVSNGMILAEDELDIGTDHDGIMVLADDGAAPGEPRPELSPGMPLASVLPIATEVLVLEVTPNRPDCLGLYGVAREVHAATGAELGPPPWLGDPGAPVGSADGPPEGISITVECPELCPRFTARVFEEVRIGPSPPWLKARLMAAGQRPISNVVDITNYVMLLTGQPLHAFDLDRVAGGTLTVRRAGAGETVETLDGQTRTVDPDVVLIADAEGPTSIAGVMGGARSEVHAGTTRVLMEAATWDGPNIHRTSLGLGLRSEASGRFEKGLQPEQTLEAQAVAARLMVELCGARLVPGTVDVGGPGPAPVQLRLRDARVASLLGAPVARERSAEILTALGFEVGEAEDGLDVRVPPFRRADVTREADLVEEVARLDGLDRLPVTLPPRRGASGRLTPRQRLRRQVADVLTGQGLHEIVGWSFVGPELDARLGLPPGRPAVTLANPMSVEQSRLRTTLLGSLLDVAARNRSRGAGAVRVFEAGAVYLPGGSGSESGVGAGERAQPDEPHHIAALLLGPARSATWREPGPPEADFFAAKGVLGAVLDAVRVPWDVAAMDAPEPFLHPGRAAVVRVCGAPVGWLGEIHPAVAARWDLGELTLAAFEIDLDAVPEPVTPLFVDLTSFPEVREDLAVVVAETESAARVLEVARRAGAPLLARAEVFDVYRDPERLGAGHVSLALRLAYRAEDRTLTDPEVAAVREAILGALASELGGRIRG